MSKLCSNLVMKLQTRINHSSELSDRCHYWTAFSTFSVRVRKKMELLGWLKICLTGKAAFMPFCIQS